MPGAWPNGTDERFAAFEYAGKPQAEDALRAAWGWANDVLEGRASGLVLSSQTYGAGKTHLAMAAAYTLKNLGRIGTFLSEPDWFDTIRQSYSDERPERALFQGWAKSPFIILDDVGTAHVATPGWGQEKWFKLVDSLVLAGSSLFITTNLDAMQLPAYLGGKVYSRLAGLCGERGFVDMSRLPDYRLSKKAGL